MVVDIFIPIGVIIGLIFTAWILLAYAITRGIEEPKYKILKKYPKFEIREYPPYIIAFTDVTTSFGESSSAGFRILANYIFGGNKSIQKIKMTAPVIQDSIESTSEKIKMTTPVIQEKKDKSYRITFVMPSNYTLDTLPIPVNPNIKIKEILTELVAVYEFKGWATEKNVNLKRQELIRLLEENNLSFTDIKLAQYDPAYTPPFMRRNELQARLLTPDFLNKDVEYERR